MQLTVVPRQPLPDDEARDVLIQLVSALGYLHRNDIIHRDISPANLLVTADGHVKVADFGLSVHHAKGDGGTGGKATFCGTANFIAPEVVLRQPHSPSSDVWSLGCLLVFMLTGTPPFGPTAGGRRSMNEGERHPSLLTNCPPSACGLCVSGFTWGKSLCRRRETLGYRLTPRCRSV